jgi:uncharacterized protein involved in exopolysaccharide biosynthesis
MQQTRSSLPANLSGLASQFGLSLPTGDVNQSPSFYVDLLSSREILSAVVDTRFAVPADGTTREADLTEWLKARGRTAALKREDAIKKLGSRVTVSSSVRTGVITLDVTTRNPLLSQQINQRMLSLLNEFNLEKRQSQASAERKFTEARLEESERQLRDAEDRLLAFTQRNRDTRNSPLLTLEQDRLSREVSMRQQVYTTLVQAYDRAKIDEVRDTPVITLLLEPEAPVKPDSRGVVSKTLLVFILGLILGVLSALVLDSTETGDRERSAELAELERYREQLGQDLRHPLRTLGRLVRLGAGTPPSAGNPAPDRG